MSISSDCDSERRQPPADPFAIRRRAVACCAVAESRVEWAPRYWTGIRYPAQQPLHVAAACGQVDTIESLLRQARPSVPSPGTELSHPRRRRCHASRTVMPHAGVCMAGLVCRCARTRWIGAAITGLLGGAQARGRSATGAVSAPVAWRFACGGCLEARRGGLQWHRRAYPRWGGLHRAPLCQSAGSLETSDGNLLRVISGKGSCSGCS